MSYVCPNPERYENRVVLDGHCAKFVQVAAGAPLTATWSPGQRIKDAAYITPGTAIATFIDGRYPNNEHGNHAAIYISHDERGIRVWDQWRGKPVSQRTIRYKEGNNDPSNDGDFYHVIE